MFEVPEGLEEIAIEGSVVVLKFLSPLLTNSLSLLLAGRIARLKTFF